MLLDSNVIIYAIKPEYGSIRDLITKNETFISAISYLEVLGYHWLTDEDKKDFNEFFEAAAVIPISHDILEKAAELRQQRRMTLGDAIVAATALINELVLVTANEKDFSWIPGLTVLNPLK